MNYQKVRSRELNEYYFEDINSEDKAYFLGLLMADGCIIKDPIGDGKSHDRIVIALCEPDQYILEKLRDYIAPNKNITSWESKNRKWRKQYKFQISSNKISSDLNKLGISPRKSGNEKFPNLSDNLYKHFIRGFFDGDGCCYVKHINKKDKTGGTYINYIVFTCLNKQFLYDMQKQLGGIGNIYEHSKKSGRKNIFSYEIGKKKDVLTFFNIIYSNSELFLKRKYNKFLNVNPVLTNILKDTSSVETSD